MAVVYRLVFLIVVVALMILAIAVGIQNGIEEVDLNLLIWSWNGIPLVVVMIECIAFGMFLTIIIGAPYEIRLWARLRAQRKKMKTLRVELDNMRNLPLSDLEEAVAQEPLERQEVEEETEKETEE